MRRRPVSVCAPCVQSRDGGTSLASSSQDSPTHLSSGVRVTRSPARNPLSFRMMQAKVTLLDGSLFTCTVEVRHVQTGETGGGARLHASNRWRFHRNELLDFNCLKKSANT